MRYTGNEPSSPPQARPRVVATGLSREEILFSLNQSRKSRTTLRSSSLRSTSSPVPKAIPPRVFSGYAVRCAGRGFTLAEVLVASLIMGIALTAIMTAIGSSTLANHQSSRVTQAVFLAQEVREWTIGMPFDDLAGLAGATYSPPKNSLGEPITNLTDWSETINLTWRADNDIMTVVEDGSSDLVFVEIAILYKGEQALTTGWLVTKKQED